MAHRRKFELPDEAPRPRDESYLDDLLGPDDRMKESSSQPVPERDVVGRGDVQGGGVEVASQESEARRPPLVALRPGKEAEGRAVESAAAPDVERPSVVATDPVRRQSRSVAGDGGRGRRTPAVAGSLPQDGARYAELEERLSAVLRPSHLTALRIIYENTVAIGEEEYRVAGPKLAEEVGVERRQLTNVLLKLERLKVIEKEEWTQEKRSLGLVFRFTGFRSV